MEASNAAQLLAALGHESRLAIFRLLMEAGPAGMHAGAIGERLGFPFATLSFHLSRLGRVGLIKGEREGRFIHYSVAFGTMDALTAYLTGDCCRAPSCPIETTRRDAAATHPGGVPKP